MVGSASKIHEVAIHLMKAVTNILIVDWELLTLVGEASSGKEHQRGYTVGVWPHQRHVRAAGRVVSGQTRPQEWREDLIPCS